MPFRGGPTGGEEKEEALAAGTAAFKSILTENEVDEATQLAFFHRGMTQTSHFTTIGSTDADIRQMLKDDFCLDPAEGFAIRLQIGAVANAWSSAKKQKQKSEELQAEAKASGTPFVLQNHEFIILRKAAEKTLPKWDQNEIPSRVYVSKLMAEAGEDEPSAHCLSEVTGKDVDDTDRLKSEIDPITGKIQVRLVAKHGRLPRNPGELRIVHRRMANAWYLVYMKHGRTRPWLRDYTTDVFRRLTETFS